MKKNGEKSNHFRPQWNFDLNNNDGTMKGMNESDS